MKREVLIYLISINILGIILTIYDKIASKKFRKNRIRENVLLLIGALGGAVSMYITMKLIRHKTRHKKFMADLPIILILQVSFLIYKLKFVG
ncbi:MAG: DUF1294 domain-containing protein [Anaerococcus sp.]|uniref:DUF1294 domain-containing protein n=1 Tax=Anaerococcus sp. TaxID=1872515 RepID=UPI0025C42744|nr:DUF1294 domain-containing protein [Anaerococcus sp.]MCI5971427.1 DUF1294 domain-containing protein [Anaerococcus sp.]